MSEIFRFLQDFADESVLFHGSWLLYVVTAALVTYHILLYKRDTVSATGWIGVVWLSPFLGSFLYLMFGINRIRRKAVLIREEKNKIALGLDPSLHAKSWVRDPGIDTLPAQKLATYVTQITRRPLCSIDSIEILRSGEEAYPAMLAAICDAKKSVFLTTYIFDTGTYGDQFIEALAKAQSRGVQVRVLVDAIGSRYSFPSAVSALRRKGVVVRKFLPNLYPWQFAFLNLRNHRKILVVDEETGFTGGMNIRDKHVRETAGSSYTNDLHFRLRGQVVVQMLEAFAEDWEFSAKERLRFDRPISPATSQTLSGRVVTDGPDVDFEKLRWTLFGAIQAAEKKIWIVTPYFLPDSALIDALGVARIRGVDVRLIVPEVGNILPLNWAMSAQFKEVLERGIAIYRQKPPFDHSKFMIVDDYWSFIGSANWDSRSLLLNFEMNVEVYSQVFAESLSGTFLERQRSSNLMTVGAYKSVRLPARIRNNASRLLAPYL